MIITNKYNLPQTFVNIMKRPTYSKGKANISATELLNSPRIVQLRKLHEDKIETDVTEMVWSIFGTAIHGVLEHGKDENHLIEERLHTSVDGWSISGAIDLQIVNEDGTVTINDYKTCGAWSVMNEKIDWEYQLNIYAWLVEKVKGTKVSKLEIVAIIRDWSRRDAALKQSYPDAPIKVIPIQLWPMDKTEDFIKERSKNTPTRCLTWRQVTSCRIALPTRHGRSPQHTQLKRLVTSKHVMFALPMRKLRPRWPSMGKSMR